MRYQLSLIGHSRWNYYKISMAHHLTAQIKVGKYKVNYANSVEIMSSSKELGDHCTITLPNMRGQLERTFKTGDPVEVQLGYDGNNRVEFVGYVTEVSPKTPFSLKCEDMVYKLKRTSVNAGKGQAWKSITLKELLQVILKGFTVHLADTIPDVILSPFRIEKGATVAQALQQLKESYLLTSYFRGETLFVGLAYTEFAPQNTEVDRQAGKYVRYNFRRNVASDTLVFKRKEDVKLKAKVISILKDNKRIEVQVGDEEGEERSLHFRNITDESKLKALGEAELEKYKYNGYRGALTGFGLPYIVHSSTVELADDTYPERAGNYVSDSVKTTWGTAGFRREVTLGRKVS